MSDETQVNNAQAGTEQNVPASDGGMNGSNVADLKDILGPVFGTQFKSDQDALKSVESAKNMAGKVGQLESQLRDLQGKLAASKSPELEAKLSEVEKMVKEQGFYAQYPEYNTPEAKALIAKMGSDPAQVVQDEVFKTAFGAIKSVKETEASKSVLMSNPRLGQVQDKITQAKEASKAGNIDVAASTAAAAVIEAYDLK